MKGIMKFTVLFIAMFMLTGCDLWCTITGGRSYDGVCYHPEDVE